MNESIVKPVAVREFPEDFARRCLRASSAVAGYMEEAEVELETPITDLMVDLLHLAHANGLNCEALMERVAMHHVEELEGEV